MTGEPPEQPRADEPTRRPATGERVVAFTRGQLAALLGLAGLLLAAALRQRRRFRGGGS